MHAIPEKLSALRQSLEATMIRQNVETRQEFEKKLRDSCKDTEDLALQRSEELLAPQMRAMSERLQGLIQAVQLRAEEAFPKIAEVADQLSSTRAEVQPLHQRADAAAARLDRVAVETSTTSKDCHDLNQDFKDVIADLRTKIAEEVRRREAGEEKHKVMLEDKHQEGSRGIQAASDKADNQANDMLARLAALEERMSRRLDEQAERTLKEWKLGDEELTNRLRLEIQAVSQQSQKRYEEAQEHAEGIVRNATATLRTELDAASKRITSAGERNVEQKARELISRMNDGFEAANRRSDTVRESCGTALHDSTTVLRKAVSDTRASLSAEAQALRQLITGVETRSTTAIEECERKALDAATRRLQDTAADVRMELSEAKQALLDGDETLRQNLKSQMDQAVLKLEQNIQDAAVATSGSAALALGQAVTQLQSELADTLKAANARTDGVRSSAAEQLSKEVQARQEALAAAQAGRDQLDANLRAELKNVADEALASSTAMTNRVDRRVDAANDAIKSLERSLEATNKELTDTTAALRNQLKTERQLTEEMGAERLQQAQEVRDTLEAHLQSEASDLRTALADARKKIYEEANALRAELREQPTKRELVELASTTTEQYNELNNAIDGHRSRLEAAVADYGTRVREAKSEAAEARLRMQRESMALAAEITTLRGASSSLANGVIKALQVIGFVREEVELASGKDGGKRGAPEEKVRGIEIEDLLEWEKVGKSLATRIARQWYLKETAGVPSVLSLVERKADAEELVVLKTLIKECSPGSWTAKLNETGSTMAPPSAPPSPKPATGVPPSAVNKVREQRMVGADGSMRVVS